MAREMKSSALSIIGDAPHGESSSSCGSQVSITSPVFNVTPKEFSGNAAVVTLGCAKNQVDSEIMLGVLKNTGFNIVSDLNQAEVLIVNTCGFLESSVKESIDCVLDVSELKKTARLRKLIVAGCAVERFKGEFKSALPEADLFITPDQLLSVGEAATGEFKETLSSAARPYFLYDEEMPRQISTEGHTAYVKVSEGCNRPCTFCVIPSIRGKMRSRRPSSIISEIKQLGQSGVKEVNIVAQDLTSYGLDLDNGSDKSKVTLNSLLCELERAGDVPWIRLLYAYPIGVTEELLRTISTSKNICKYFDIPLQHSSESVLALMKRPLGRYSPRAIVKFIKEIAPNIKIRTTFIVGFPGETLEDVEDLASFIREGHFSSVGIFTYSKEDGTPSFSLDGHISEKEKIRRKDHLMKIQQEVVANELQSYVGKTLKVLLEGTHEETDLLWVGRAEFQAPEVDGQVIINDITDGETLPKKGDFASVLITEVKGYDLIGRIEGRTLQH